MHCFHFSVKFSIKSFKVPELCIDIPENATVGSLKVGNFLVICCIMYGCQVEAKNAI